MPLLFRLIGAIYLIAVALGLTGVLVEDKPPATAFFDWNGSEQMLEQRQVIVKPNEEADPQRVGLDTFIIFNRTGQ